MSSFHKTNLTEDVEFSMRTPEFATDKVFESREELMDWVQNTGRSLGVVIVTKRSNKISSGFVNKVVLMCDRSGEYRVKDSSRVTGTKKCKCPFELEGKFSKEHEYWTLRVLCDEHNHQPIKYMEGHPYVKRLSENEISLVEDLSRKNVAPRDILAILKERNVNNVSTIKNIYNIRQKLRMVEQVGKSPMQVLMSLLHSNGYVYEFCTNDSNELENLFFVHPTSFDIWRAFPHVLLIDATYKTNKYNMPFVQIVGVTSTRMTFSIGFAFIENEREANYTWVLNCLKLTLDACMHPRVIVTDRELALMNACERVFPNATQLLCRWHISNNIIKNCRQSFKSHHDWDSFMSSWKLLEESPTLISYNENYKQLQSTLIKYQRVLNYVDQVWLNKYKEKFVSVWIDQHLNFGNRTTNRVESQHSRLKKYLKSAKCTLDRFVRCINQIVQDQFREIKGSFEKSRIYRIHQHNLPCFELLRGVVSNEALELMHKELQRSNGLQCSSNCGCQLRHSSGLPCACELLVYINSGQRIPLDSIDIFWRKIDISPSTTIPNDDISCDDELKHFRENFNKQPKVVKRSLLQKLRDIFGQSTIDVQEPKVKKITRGRPRLKNKQQKKRVDPTTQEPRRYSYSAASNFVELDSIKEPMRHSSYVMDMNQESMGDCSYVIDLNEEPTRNNPFVIDLNEEPTNDNSYLNFQTYYSHPLMSQIPNMFHPYITRIQNVMSDGNCGFRAISVCLGYGEDQWLNIRHQLLDELNNGKHAYTQVFTADFDNVHRSLCFSSSPAPKEHWMIMPLTGLLIANKFGVIVHCLSLQGCTTCFPLWKGPGEFQHHQALTIAHIYGNHFVMVQLQGQYPMPPITAYWNYYKSPYAAEWEIMYAERLNSYGVL